MCGCLLSIFAPSPLTEPLLPISNNCVPHGRYDFPYSLISPTSSHAVEDLTRTNSLARNILNSVIF